MNIDPVRFNVQSFTVSELLSAYGAVLDELRSREIVRSSNSPLSDYGELPGCARTIPLPGRPRRHWNVQVLKDLRRRLDPLKRSKSPLSVPPPRSTRFGSPLVLSRLHWVEPRLVAEMALVQTAGSGPL
jgi:hypothetical protein